MERLLAILLTLGPVGDPGEATPEEPATPESDVSPEDPPESDDGGTDAPTATETLQEDPAERAGRLFVEGDFAAAAIAFEEAYRLHGDPALLFGWAQAQRRSGDCRGAIDTFEKFIETGPPEADVQEAKGVIEACEEILGEDEAAAAPVSDPVPPAELPPEDEPPKKRRDPLAGALLGSGLGLVGLGTVLYAVGWGLAADRDPGEEHETTYEQRERRTRGLGISGITFLAVGGALTVGGIVRYVIVKQRRREEGDATARVRPPLTWYF